MEPNEWDNTINLDGHDLVEYEGTDLDSNPFFNCLIDTVDYDVMDDPKE